MGGEFDNAITMRKVIQKVSKTGEPWEESILNRMQDNEIKGNLKPVFPNNLIWDTSKVLNFLDLWQPVKILLLVQLSVKTVMLCLLLTGQRGQSIYMQNGDK